MWVQTWHPQHPLFAALRRHDYPAFAASQLKERERPACRRSRTSRSCAPMRARWRRRVRSCRPPRRWRGRCQAPTVMVYPPVPMGVARVANVERMQMLVESASRAALQRFLGVWLPLSAARGEMRGKRSTSQGRRRILRWAVDVDP